MLLIATVLVGQQVASIEAKTSHRKKASKSHKHRKHRGRHHEAGHGNPVAPATAPPPGQGSLPADQPYVFDVLSYGAKGDGESDDSKVSSKRH